MSDFKHIAQLTGQIIEGHANKALDKVGLLKDEVKAMADERFSYCLVCAFTPHPTKPGRMGPGLTSENRCDPSKGGCNCDMLAKTKVKSATCPIGRW